MSGARVQSIEVLGVAKVALVDLKDRLGTGLSEATSDLERFAQWLEQEQPRLLASQLRRQEDAVVMAKSALYRKGMVVSSKDSKPSVVDEKKALQRAIERAEDTRRRLAAVKKWAVAFQRELLLFKGAVGGLQGAIDHDLPLAIATVSRMAISLERYVSEQAPDVERLFGEAQAQAAAALEVGAAGAMRRGGVDGVEPAAGAAQKPAPGPTSAPRTEPGNP